MSGEQAAVAEVQRRLRQVFGRVCAEPCPHVGCQAQHIAADVLAALATATPARLSDEEAVFSLADALYRARQARTVPDTLPEMLDAQVALDWFAALAPTATEQVAAMKDVADHAARQVADVEGRRE